jgi:hypothetical protein
MQRSASRGERHPLSAVPSATLVYPGQSRGSTGENGLWVSIGVSRDRAIPARAGRDTWGPGTAWPGFLYGIGGLPIMLDLYLRFEVMVILVLVVLRH